MQPFYVAKNTNAVSGFSRSKYAGKLLPAYLEDNQRKHRNAVISTSFFND